MDDALPNDIPELIRELMPHATETELLDAADNFRGYIAIVLRIYERRQRKKEAFDSPDSRPYDTLDDANTRI
jgi:hypothetical protein